MRFPCSLITTSANGWIIPLPLLQRFGGSTQKFNATSALNSLGQVRLRHNKYQGANHYLLIPTCRADSWLHREPFSPGDEHNLYQALTTEWPNIVTTGDHARRELPNRPDNIDNAAHQRLIPVFAAVFGRHEDDRAMCSIVPRTPERLIEVPPQPTSLPLPPTINHLRSTVRPHQSGLECTYQQRQVETKKAPRPRRCCGCRWWWWW